MSIIAFISNAVDIVAPNFAILVDFVLVLLWTGRASECVLGMSPWVCFDWVLLLVVDWFFLFRIFGCKISRSSGAWFAGVPGYVQNCCGFSSTFIFIAEGWVFSFKRFVVVWEFCWVC